MAMGNSTMLNSIQELQETVDEVTPYSMHVSSRYLELTKKKLQFTRLPRELEVQLPEERRWDLGTPKAVLEPLLDYWLETYDWRTQESHFNTSLPQFRTTIKIRIPPSPQSPTSRASRTSTASRTTAGTSTSASTSTSTSTPTQSLRVHFVHKRSKHKNAIPLLFCHNWPSSFIEVHKIIDALTDPQSLPSFGAGAQQAFHVVVPSIPGFGFSDAGSWEGFGVGETAEAFQGVMGRLGYARFVGCGVGWGFQICRALALNHPTHCLAIHTANPSFPEPTLKINPMVYLKHRIARLTRARCFSFGYTPAEVQPRPPPSHDTDAALTQAPPIGSTLSPLYALRPQTVAFSLCDSPIGLLAGMLDIIHTRAPPASSTSPITSRSRSPFLSPVELEMEEASIRRSNSTRSARTRGPSEPPFSPRDQEYSSRSYTWTPTEVLNWTMLQWLPGPESSLRWLRRATLDTAPTTPFSTAYCPVPLGISSFQAPNRRVDSGNVGNAASNPACSPLMWGSASWRIAWVKRHQRPAAISPAWEAPDLLVLDMRECFGTFVEEGLIKFPDAES